MTECCAPWDFAAPGLVRAREVLTESLHEKEELEKLNEINGHQCKTVLELTS